VLARKAMVPDTYFQHYAAVNRISQELLWDSVIDSIDSDPQALRAEAASAVDARAGHRSARRRG
jgi:hypothetical protein